MSCKFLSLSLSVDGGALLMYLVTHVGKQSMQLNFEINISSITAAASAEWVCCVHCIRSSFVILLLKAWEAICKLIISQNPQLYRCTTSISQNLHEYKNPFPEVFQAFAGNALNACNFFLYRFLLKVNRCEQSSTLEHLQLFVWALLRGFLKSLLWSIRYTTVNKGRVVDALSWDKPNCFFKHTFNPYSFPFVILKQTSGWVCPFQCSL